MFAQILDLLAQGRGVQIIPKDVELSTQQAASLLNVSRPYLISLLESGKIPFRKVGRHPRITFEVLMDFTSAGTARSGVRRPTTSLR
jgi:excisionase family DNA binding protein